MADIEDIIDGDIREENAAPETRWSLKKGLAAVRALGQDFDTEYYISHPIFENMRRGDMGRLCFGIILAVLPGVAYVKFNIKEPNNTLFEFILFFLLAGMMALIFGILFRDTYRLAACNIELLGIVFVCLSIIGLFASLLSGLPSRIILGFCAALLLLLPFIVPFLPRENASTRTN
ncbi:hypothetical protein F511_31803 [Dorcoceras hygrometricum]|uniref:Uncharacterized protein n=1 Tax=Dorcoceras hygrometricum TaxID=472368 RepID=A0A2Z7AGA3_9LAMI|nr:hypothetical protein F511_31803 [Dorcoceras hygrometricum]